MSRPRLDERAGPFRSGMRYCQFQLPDTIGEDGWDNVFGIIDDRLLEGDRQALANAQSAAMDYIQLTP